MDIREDLKFPPGTIAKTYSSAVGGYGTVLVLGYQWFDHDVYYEVIPVNPEGQPYGEPFDVDYLRAA